MQLSEEVLWTLSDFVIAFILLFSAGFAVWLVVTRVRNMKQRLIALAVVLFLFFLIWAELAVGIFGTPFAGS
ncbi:MAG: hypothetical protein ACOCXH_15540 [Cyclobacteriaceae bacterium]